MIFKRKENWNNLIWWNALFYSKRVKWKPRKLWCHQKRKFLVQKKEVMRNNLGNVLMGKRLKKFCFSEEKQFKIIYNLNWKVASSIKLKLNECLAANGNLKCSKMSYCTRHQLNNNFSIPDSIRWTLQNKHVLKIGRSKFLRKYVKSQKNHIVLQLFEWPIWYCLKTDDTFVQKRRLLSLTLNFFEKRLENEYISKSKWSYCWCK